MGSVFLILQIIFSLILIAFILLQAKGTGFGRSMGGASSSSFTRRGLEKVVFRATFIVAALFVVVSIAQIAL